MSKSKLVALLIGTVVIIGAIVGLAFYFKSQKPAQPSQQVATTPPQQEKGTMIPAGTYFATVNSGAKLPEKSISIYAMDGSQVKKLPYPSQGVTKAAGDAMYLGSTLDKRMNSIASFSLKTGTFADLAFTNTANGILAWDVSPDHARLAWIGADQRLTVANADGSNPESHQLPKTSPTGAAPGWAMVQFSADGRSILAATVGSWNIWRMDKKAFDPLPATDDQIFSSTLANGAPLHDSDGVIVITDTGTGAASTVFVEPPDEYVQLSEDSQCMFAPLTTVVAFSPDEAQLLLKIGAPCDGEKSETFIAYIDGGITRLLLKGYSPLAYLDQQTILVKKDGGGLAIASTDDGKILKELPDQTEYLGMMKTTEGF